MKFSPVFFQGALASAGMTLMPYNYMKTNLLAKYGINSFRELSLVPMSPFDQSLGMILSILMLLFIVLHFLLTFIFVKNLVKWFRLEGEFKKMLSNPLANSALFSPLISLPMSLIVLFGPVSFFMPQIQTNSASLIKMGLPVFIVLWLAVIFLKAIVYKVLLTRDYEIENLNFSWLLDILALGAVSLLGSSFASMIENEALAITVGLMTTVALMIGVLDFTFKLVVLIYLQFKSKQMPATPMVPAFFLVIPPTCLLWFSVYKMLNFADSFFGVSLRGISFIVINLAYFSTVVAWILLITVLFDYFKNRFLTSDFSPAQWGIV